MKQTAVEALVDWMNKNNGSTSENLYNAFEQAKQMEKQQQGYSEEDMDNYAEYCTTHVLKSKTGHPYLSVKEWFEQFKKK